MAKDRSPAARLKTLSIIALCCSFVACVSLIIALATDHWQDIEVDRSGLLKIVQYKPELEQAMNTDVLYYDRHRGLFYYCRAALRRFRIIPETICVRDLAFESSPVLDLSHLAASPRRLRDVVADMNRRKALVITTTVSMVAGDVSALFACVIGLVALFVRRRRRVVYTAAMSVVFMATVFAGSAIAIFHGLDFLERTKLNVYMFPAAVQEERFYDELSSHTDIHPGYSYYVGWLGVMTSCASAVLYLYARMASPPASASTATAGLGASKSTSTLRLAETTNERRRKKATGRNGGAKLPPLPTYNSAYAMMESSNNSLSADVSEKASTRTPPSDDDWNPDLELAPDDPIHFQ